jgi:hypothetical protein
MANGILGQSAPAATTNTTVYTVPAATTATFSVSICNRGSSAANVRLAVSATGTPGNSEWLEYDAAIPPFGVLERTGIVAQATKNVVVYASSANTSVTVFGFEEV